MGTPECVIQVPEVKLPLVVRLPAGRDGLACCLQADFQGFLGIVALHIPYLRRDVDRVLVLREVEVAPDLHSDAV